jgi:hypothetical protein
MERREEEDKKIKKCDTSLISFFTAAGKSGGATHPRENRDMSETVSGSSTIARVGVVEPSSRPPPPRHPDPIDQSPHSNNPHSHLHHHHLHMLLAISNSVN